MAKIQPEFCRNRDCRSRHWNGKRQEKRRYKRREFIELSDSDILPDSIVIVHPPRPISVTPKIHRMTVSEAEELHSRLSYPLTIEERVDYLKSHGDIDISPDGTIVKLRSVVYPGKKLTVYPFIDYSDLPIVIDHTVYALRSNGIPNASFDVRVSDKTYKTLRRLLMNVTERGVIVRHKNGDRLDHRRSNLIVVPKNSNYRPRAFPDYGYRWPKARVAVLERSCGICELCNKRVAKHVHHRMPVRFFSNPDDSNDLRNLVAVCMPCHRLEHIWIRKNLPLFHFMLSSWIKNRETKFSS